MPKNTKTNTKVSLKTKPVKKHKLGTIKKKTSKIKDLEKEIDTTNLKRGIIEVLNLTQEEISSEIEPNNPQIITSTPIKNTPQTSKALVDPQPTTSTADTDPEINPISVEAEKVSPNPLKQLELSINPQFSPPDVIVTPPTPDRVDENPYVPEQNSQLLVPPQDPTKFQENKRPPDIPDKLTHNLTQTPIPKTIGKSNTRLLTPRNPANPNPSLPKLRLKKILNQEKVGSPVFELINPEMTGLNDSVNNSSIRHVDQSRGFNSSQLTFQQVENLNRTLQIKISNLIEENKMMENKLDKEKEYNKREKARHEWKLKQAQMEIRMLKINIQEKEGRIKNQEDVILSSYIGYNQDKNKSIRTEDKTYKELLRDNKRLENMITTTRRQIEEESNKKENFKKEMLKAKRDLLETNNRIKDAANDEAKKMLDDLMRTKETLTVDLDLATQKIKDLKDNNKELADRIKQMSNSNSIVQPNIRDSEPYQTEPDHAEQQKETHRDIDTTKDDIYDGKTVTFRNSHMDHQQLTNNQHMIIGPHHQHNQQRERNKKDIICKYWVEERCMFGNRCYYKHPNEPIRNYRRSNQRPTYRHTSNNRIPDLRTTNFQRPPDLQPTNQQTTYNRTGDLRTSNFQRLSPWQNPNAQRLTSNPPNGYVHTEEEFPHLSQDKSSNNPIQQRNPAHPRKEFSYSHTLQASQRPHAPEDISPLINLSQYLNQLNHTVNELNSTNTPGPIFLPVIPQCS